MTYMQKTRDVLAHVAIPVAIVAVGYYGLMLFGQKPPRPEREQTSVAQTIVETVPVELFEGAFTINVEGVAVPLRQVQTSAQVAGQVTMKAAECRGGQYVEQGTTLLEIDPINYELERDRLQAQLEQATENLTEVQVDIGNTEQMIKLAQEEIELQRRNLKRVQQLYGRGASTDTGLDDARRQELISRNARQSLLNQLRSSRQRQKSLTAAQQLVSTQLSRAETDIQRTKIAAPVSGTIVTTDVEEGDYVKVGDPLFRTNDTDDMEVSCQLRVDELYWIWLQSGTFSADESLPDVTFEIPKLAVEVAFAFHGVEYLWDGELFRYDGTGLDPLTRTVPCRVLVKEPTHVRVGGGERGLVAPPTLISGMYVKVRIPITPPIPLVEVPNTALQPSGDVWLVRNGALDIVPVEVARLNGTDVLLRPTSHGPQPGELVVVSPLAAPTQGLAVEAINPNSPLERAAAMDKIADITDTVTTDEDNARIVGDTPQESGR